MIKYYYCNPNDEAAKWHMHGQPMHSVIAQATKLAVKIGQMVPVSYEDITASGTVKDTGDAAFCYASGKVHCTGRGMRNA